MLIYHHILSNPGQYFKIEVLKNISNAHIHEISGDAPDKS